MTLARPGAEPTPGRVWDLKPRRPAAERALREGGKAAELTVRLLAQRGIDTVEQARAFLRPDIRSLNDPFLMEDMDKAVRRIRKAVFDREPILVHGDYDVDGVTGTALLARFFKLVHADLRTFVPHRVEDGYSLQRGNLERFAAEGVKVLITVDCGATNLEEITYANSLGLDVIVTDHHAFKEEMPPAYAMLCPNMPGTNYPFPSLCGCGVAFKLACALAEALSPDKKLSDEMQQFLHTALGFVSIGTVADVMPLVGENRTLVHAGLRALTHSPSPGLRALLTGAGLDDGRDVRVSDISFRIAPKINAAGRMDSPEAALALLVCNDTRESIALEAALTEANERRREIERVMQEQAREKLADWNFDDKPFLVLHDERWHPGVIGILAARIAQEYYRPTIVISAAGAKGKGSGRTVPGFHLYDAIQSAEGCLLSFGGHANAAGFEIDIARVGEFTEAVNAYTRDLLRAQPITPTLPVDLETDFSDLTLTAMQEFERMEPFGQGNPQPLCLTRNVRIVGQPRLVGATGNHLSFHAAHEGRTLKCIAFQFGPALHELSGGPVDLVYAPGISRWRGDQAVELDIKDFRPSR